MSASSLNGTPVDSSRFSDFLGRLQPSKTTIQRTPGTLGVEESSSPRKVQHLYTNSSSGRKRPELWRFTRFSKEVDNRPHSRSSGAEEPYCEVAPNSYLSTLFQRFVSRFSRLVHTCPYLLSYCFILSHTFCHLLPPSPTFSDLLRPSLTFSYLLQPSSTFSHLLTLYTFSHFLTLSRTFANSPTLSLILSNFL